MSFTYEDKRIDSLYVDKIWHTHTTSEGVYTANVDGNWDIIISRHKGSVSVTVNGIGKEAATVPYTSGIETIGIALKPGVFLRDMKGKDIVETQHILSDGDTSYVKIADYTFLIPSFDSAEAFVNQLIDKGVLGVNAVVSSFSAGGATSTSARTLRRHVSQTTGLSPHFLHQVQRAQHATQLLQQGMSISQAANEAGYTDQAHMTKSVKQLMGRTPAQIIAASKQ